MRDKDTKFLEEQYSKLIDNKKEVVNEGSFDPERFEEDPLDYWMEKRRMYHPSKETLEAFAETVGYGDGPYMSPLDEFFSDNPFAFEVIFEKLSQFVDRNEEWKESLREDVEDAVEDEVENYE